MNQKWSAFMNSFGTFTFFSKIIIFHQEISFLKMWCTFKDLIYFFNDKLTMFFNFSFSHCTRCDHNKNWIIVIIRKQNTDGMDLKMIICWSVGWTGIFVLKNGINMRIFVEKPGTTYNSTLMCICVVYYFFSV
jgi:hypothetical protein